MPPKSKRVKEEPDVPRGKVKEEEDSEDDDSIDPGDD